MTNGMTNTGLANNLAISAGTKFRVYVRDCI